MTDKVAYEDRLPGSAERMSLLLFAMILLCSVDYRIASGSGAMSISLGEATAYAAAIAGLLRFVSLPTDLKRLWISRIVGVNKYVVAYIAWICCAAAVDFVSYGNDDGLHSLKDAIPGVVLYLTMIVTVTSDVRLGLCHRMLAVSACIATVLGLSQYAFAWPYPRNLNDLAWLKTTFSGELVTNPIVGTLGHPNGFAMVIGPFLLLTEIMFLERRTKMSIARLGLFVALYSTLFLTFAKAPLIWTTLAVVGLWGLPRDTKSKFLMRTVLIVFLAIFVSVAAGVIVYSDSGNVPDNVQETTLATRLLLDYSAIGMLMENGKVLIFGGGMSSFSGYTSLDLSVHNEYLTQTMRFGVPGALLFVVMLADAVRRALVRRWRYAVPLVVIMMICFLESANGCQLQSVLFLVLAFVECSSVTSGSRYSLKQSADASGSTTIEYALVSFQ